MALACLLGAAAALTVLALPLGQRLGRRTGWVISAGLTALAGGLLVIWFTTGATGLYTEFYPWLPALDVAIRLRLDGLALLFGLVVLIVGALVMAYAVYYLPDGGRHGVFYGLLTFFAAAMLLLVLSDDLVVMWVAWEFTTLCSFLLIQQSGPKGRGPAVRTLLVTGMGGLCLLAAVALTIATTGTTQLGVALASPAWAATPAATSTVAVLVALAAFTKSAQFPFHAWLPDAMVASTPVSAYLHAAAMVKAGIYLLLRFSTAFAEVGVWNLLLIAVGLFTAVLGSIYALPRHDLKELLAYSTISQLGFLVATIGVGTRYALLAALVHVVAHATFKSSLFMAVGLIDHETSTRDLRKLSDLRHTMPATTLCLALAAASMAGLPPLFGFISKEAMFKALSSTPFGLGLTVIISVLAVVGATCTFAYSARMLRPVFGAPMSNPPHEAPALMIAPVAITAAAGVVIGLVGPTLQPLIDSAADAIRTGAPGSDLALWHGLNVALGMSVAVIVLGSLLVLARTQVDHLVVGRRMGFVRMVDVVEGFRDGSIAVGAKVGDLTRRDSPFRHLAIPLVLVAALTGFMISHGLPAVPVGSSRPLDWVLTALITLGVALTLRAYSRIALVTTVGIVGFSVALLFFSLGAPDVALTQLLVEILTVVVMVLLLVRLPRFFHVTPRGRRWWAAGLALLSGATATVITMFVLAEPGLSPVGRYYLQHAYELSGGANVVNTILVDFRAFDTLGEMVVLGVAAVALVVALQARGLLPRRPSPVTVEADNPASDPVDNTITIRVIDRLVTPILIVLSLWFFLRGHYHPGGGFIGALVGGAALALIFLASSSDWVARLHVGYLRLIGTGIVLAVGTGLFGLLQQAYLRPFYVTVAGVQLSTGLLFDVGVYLTVLGLILGALARLGLDGPEPTPLRLPGEETVRQQAPRTPAQNVAALRAAGNRARQKTVKPKPRRKTRNRRRRSG